MSNSISRSNYWLGVGVGLGLVLGADLLQVVFKTEWGRGAAIGALTACWIPAVGLRKAGIGNAVCAGVTLAMFVLQTAMLIFVVPKG